MGLSAIFIFNTVSYGTIAGTWLPAIPPFDIRNRHFWKSPPPSRTFLMFLMGLPAIFKIYTVSYGTIGDTSIWFLKPPFFEISAPLLEHSCCFLWDYRRYLYLALFLMGLSPGLDYRRYLHLISETAIFGNLRPLLEHSWCFLWDYRRYLKFTLFLMGLSAIPLFDFWNRHFWNIRPPSRTFLLFLMELSAIFIFSTVSYGTIAGTWLPAIPPFLEISAPF